MHSKIWKAAHRQNEAPQIPSEINVWMDSVIVVMNAALENLKDQIGLVHSAKREVP